MDCLAQTAVPEVKKNGMFVIPGIGRLVRVDRKARMGRNPATGEAISRPLSFRVAHASPSGLKPARFRPKDALLAFLESL